MAQSDTAAWAALLERVEKLESRVEELFQAKAGRDMQPELYGDQPDHTQERAVLRRPGRPPGS